MDDKTETVELLHDKLRTDIFAVLMYGHMLKKDTVKFDESLVPRTFDMAARYESHDEFREEFLHELVGNLFRENIEDDLRSAMYALVSDAFDEASELSKMLLKTLVNTEVPVTIAFGAFNERQRKQPRHR